MIWVKCEDIVLSEISQTQKVKYLIVLLIWSTYSSQIHGAKMWFYQNSVVRGWGEWGFVAQQIQFQYLLFSRSVVSDSLWPHGLQHARLPVHHHLPELAHTHDHWVSDAIQPSHPLLSPSPPASIFPSIRVFSNESTLCIRWPKYWSFSINPSNECSGLISFKIDWFDLLAVQGTHKSLLQHHSSKAHQFFGAQPSLWPNSHIHPWLLEKP